MQMLAENGDRMLLTCSLSHGRPSEPGISKPQPSARHSMVHVQWTRQSKEGADELRHMQRGDHCRCGVLPVLRRGSSGRNRVHRFHLRSVHQLPPPAPRSGIGHPTPALPRRIPHSQAPPRRRPQAFRQAFPRRGRAAHVELAFQADQGCPHAFAHAHRRM